MDKQNRQIHIRLLVGQQDVINAVMPLSNSRSSNTSSYDVSDNCLEKLRAAANQLRVLFQLT